MSDTKQAEPAPSTPGTGIFADALLVMQDQRDSARREAEELRAELAETEAACDTNLATAQRVIREFSAVVAERDRLRAELAALKQQEPVAQVVGRGQHRGLRFTQHRPQPLVGTLLYASPIPARAQAETDCTQGDGHIYAAVSRAHLSAEQNAEVEAHIDRMVAQVQAGGETEERAAFEAAMAKAGYELNPWRYRDGPYRASYYESGWLMWQAARSQLAGKERK